MADDSTISELVAKMLLKFENEGLVKLSSSMDFDPAYPQVVFLMIKWYWRPEELGQHLIMLYQASVASESEGGATEVTNPRKWAIARAFRFWLEHFPEDFKAAYPLHDQIIHLQQLMKDNGEDGMADFISVDSLPDEPRWFQHSLSAPHPNDIRRPSLGFDATSAKDLAEIMCSLDYKLFRRIPVREFCIYAHAAKPTEETPRIDECIQLFNGLTIWVVCSILREITVVKRADIIEKFIETTRYLHELNCFNTLLAVVGGLNHFSIRRLNQTWNRVDKARREALNKRTAFFSTNLNYSIYRQAVTAASKQFHIPVLGIVLKDLVAVDAQAKDYADSAALTINMSKYRILWNLLTNIKHAQLTPPPNPPDIDHMRILRAAINQSYMNDDALEELSLAREPRHRDSSAMNTLKSEPELPKFSEWASGRSSSLDTHTIKKNVKQMVDAVFRAYDTDNSGTISMGEFDAISSNFPFIEHFSVLDQDNDGTISYDELLSYFLSANSLLRERFTHQFVEHTFISTPVCEHCKGMMKGIVKQGVRCKDCGISCHKQCKDYVVVDCSKRKEKKKKPRASSMANPHGPELYCDDEISVKERLQRAEAARDALSAENADLLARLAEANAKIQQLQSHIAIIRQHTIGFILEQMNTLNPSMDTPGTEV